VWNGEHRRDQHHDEQWEQNKLQLHANIPLGTPVRLVELTDLPG
jgi:hypothetical protein